MVRVLYLLAMPALAQDPLTFFETKVRPVLAGRCYACHSAQAKTPFAGLRVDSRQGLLQGGDRGPAVVPGKPGDSLLLEVLRHRVVAMPPGGKLAEEEIAAIERWIAMGAPWPEEAPKPPTVSAEGGERKPLWSLQPLRKRGGTIDALVREGLAAKGMQFSPRADRRTLLRRLSYDLTGLPPSHEELQSNESYEQAVDRLLASPHFGERWARYWLDLARYSDSGFNNIRFPYAFTYRDWVIRAYNEDMPYDRFVARQLAADQLGETRHLPALGLLSLGHNPPRASLVPDKVDDRIDVVSRTFLGLTVACARCHDHKYDPIPTKDYYALYGVFVNSREAEEPARVDAASSPFDSFYGPRLRQRLETIHQYKQRRTEEIRAEMRQPEVAARYLQAALESRKLTAPQAENLAKERNINLYVFERWRQWAKASTGDAPSAEELQAITEIPVADFGHVLTEGDANTVNNLRWLWDKLYTDYAQRSRVTRAMTVQDAQTLEAAHVFVRGNQNDHGDTVPRRFLTALGGKPFEQGSGRLDLARAIVDQRNPLTARVMVNRVWQHLFGEGLVRSVSDFGVRGDVPTHPELLDLLAAQFMEDGWSVKRLIRRIVLSDVYRQGSADNPANRLKDPENKLLWRMNRRRLDFDAARDTVLAVSGGLDRTIGGPGFSLYSEPVEPRRTMYAFVERERAQMLLKSFDYADPEQHTPQRHGTTVPQQALFFLNSTFLGEQAELVARAADGSVERLYRQVLGREPRAEELSMARQFMGQVKEEPAAAVASNGWQYGWGALDQDGGKVSRFVPFRYFADGAWQAASLQPDGEVGNAELTANGGVPGDDLRHAVIRRWVAPVSGKAEVEGTLSQNFGPYEQRFHLSNGVRGWIVSSRQGVLGSWEIDAPRVKEFTNSVVVKKDTKLTLTLEAGEVIDFVVDARDDYESDSFTWAPVIRSGEKSWDARKDFRGPSPRRLHAFAQFAQVLLLTNELMFLD